MKVISLPKVKIPLSFKLIFALVITSISLMSSYSYYEIEKTRASLEQEYRKQQKSIIWNNYNILVSSLWDLNKEAVDSLVGQIFSNTMIMQVVVYDDLGAKFSSLNKKVNGSIDLPRIRTNNDLENFKNLKDALTNKYDISILIDKISINPLENSSLERAEVPLFFKHTVGKKTTEVRFIGTLVIDYSIESIILSINEMKKRVFVLSIILAVLFMLISYFVLRRLIISPLLETKKASENVIEGNFEPLLLREPLLGRDEIYFLKSTFNIMINTVQSNLNNLKLIAEEGLKISKCLTLFELNKQVQLTVNRFFQGNQNNKNISVDFYIRGLFVSNVEQNQFFLIRGEELIAPQKNIHHFKSDIYKPLQILAIKDSLSNEVASYLYIDFEVDSVDEKKASFLLESLKISISSCLRTLQFVEEQKNQQRMEAELETARLVQQALLPKSDSLRVGLFEIAGFFRPADECGGDWWHFYPFADKRMLVMLGDVTGHGTPSAMVTAAVKGYCDSIYGRENPDPSRILEELDVVIRNSSDGERMMTMFAAIIDPNEQRICYSNAAHTFPFLIQEEPTNGTGPLVKQLIVSGKSLGFGEGYGSNEGADTRQDYLLKKEIFKINDTVVIFSDGLIEAQNTENEVYSEKRLRKIISENTGTSAKDLRNIIVQDALKFLGKEKPRDDMTLLVCKMCNQEVKTYKHEMMWYLEARNRSA